MNKKKSYDVAKIIKKAGLRATRPRLSLLSFLQKKKYPLTIQEIVNELIDGKIDQVTVYRMIDTFKLTGIVREINFHGERPRYELEDVEHDHHHIVCTNCHKLEDFIGCDYQRLEKKVLSRSRSFFKITGHSFDLYGLCNKCVK